MLRRCLRGARCYDVDTLLMRATSLILMLLCHARYAVAGTRDITLFSPRRHELLSLYMRWRLFRCYSAIRLLSAVVMPDATRGLRYCRRYVDGDTRD